MNAHNDSPANDNQDYVGSYQPPANDDHVADSVTDASNQPSEDLSSQNIFMMLGVDDGKPEEKEEFLNELQQVIWEDFLTSDLDLLVTSDEKQDIEQIRQDSTLTELDKQEKIITYLDKIIPNLEEIMMEKALELKEALIKERILGMKEYYADDQEAMDKIQKAAVLVEEGKWRSAAQLLNEIIK